MTAPAGESDRVAPTSLTVGKREPFGVKNSHHLARQAVDTNDFPNGSLDAKKLFVDRSSDGADVRRPDLHHL